MNSWRFHVLGASSTLTPPGDSTASFSLSKDNRVILIDAGGNLPAKLDDAGLDRFNISDILITHSHPDHTYGLPFLSHSFYGDHFSVNCWSTSEAIPKLEKSLEAYDLQEPERYLDVQFKSVPVDEGVEEIPLIDDLEIRTIPTIHSHPGFGLCLESSNQKIVFSGDTAPTDALKRVGEDADVLFHDCQSTETYARYFDEVHTSAKKLGEMAAEMNVSVVIPFHYNFAEFPQGWEEIAHEIRQSFDGTVLYPRQGMGFFL